ncbi:Na/Pi cotransporter family protein [Clostridium senegalense]|uniref:Na/Pi cotransporter family protein n=1 Tax=Clostridium senegalense TaxID=1465809 RepID=UPI001C106E1F|nr:Na/Pi cotransporter family protein [Clostridium senegalense]MBU5226608.1 Na/Pi cotransporter family protein [Clostridium senegalense]
MDIFTMVIQLIGGLGLFLFGMKLMGDGLENAAGEKLKGILEKVTSNKYIGVLVGAITTAVIQSSSATTVMVVSFVNAGLMTLMQAIGVIMGANIGTTITAQMVSFKLDAIAPLFIGIGAVIILTAKKKRTKDIAYITLGFGILFLGMGMMSESMEPLAQSDAFKNIIHVIGNNRILGVFAGLLMTAIVQSSSATTGILVALATTGSIDMNVALPIIFGCNIGTCVTALLASIGSSKTAKKAALLHVLFNVIGVIIFLPFMGILVNLVEDISPSSVARQVANAHTIFNIAVTIILLPLAKFLVDLVNKIVPGDDEISKIGPIYLDKKLLDTPIVAVGQALKETIRMGDIAKENVTLAMRAFLDNDEECIEKVYANEAIINELDKEITDYLVLISGHDLASEDSKILSSTFHVINDIERIGDHAENIAELALEKSRMNIEIKGEARNEVEGMYSKTLESLMLALECYSTKNSEKAKNIKEIEDSIDKYKKDIRENNIQRLNKRICKANGSAVFLDLISNLERIGDHSTNIAERAM